MRSVTEAYKHSKFIYENLGTPALVAVGEEKTALDYFGKIRYYPYKDGIKIVNESTETTVSVIYGLERNAITIGQIQEMIHKDLINWKKNMDYQKTYSAFNAIERGFERCIYNYKKLSESCLNIDPNSTQEQLNSTVDKIETQFHNFAASVYSFCEIFDENKSDIGEISVYQTPEYKKWHYQYASEIIGLRHFIQHTGNIPIKLVYDRPEITPVIFYRDILEKSFTWHGDPISDHTGKKYEPKQYYFKEREKPYFKIEQQCYVCISKLETLLETIEDKFTDSFITEGQETFSHLDKVLPLEKIDSSHLRG